MSIGARVIRLVFRLIRLRWWVFHGFRHPGRNFRTMDPARFPAGLNIETWLVEGFKLVSIHQPHYTKQHLIFLPGGAYLIEPTIFHQKLFLKLASDCGLSATFIDYPKAPEHTYLTTHRVAQKAYSEVARKFPGSEMVLLGDSAGGGLALALAQVLRDQQIQPCPGKIVLISPWLDLSMSSKEIAHYTARDHMLSLKALTYAAERYSGGEDPRNPLLSPLFGDMSNLGSVLLFFGTEEIFYPDCQSLIASLSNSQGSKVDYVIGEGMVHDWLIFPFKESRKGISKIARFIVENQPSNRVLLGK